MAIFLNTQKLNHWIPKLIQESEKELILVVPYIQTSDNIYESLQTADKNNVEITLIYRENKLSEKEKLKLISLNNLNLLHHPNIHCKCYFNGQLLIVGSMNLYDYSEINNREMGVLIHHTSLNQKGEEDDWSCGDDKALFDDAITEIREIVNGSKIEKICERSKSSSFDIHIIKTDEELEIERCVMMNKYFLNKKFKPFETSEGYWLSKCESYFDKIDVILDYHRCEIQINYSKEELKVLFEKWKSTYEEFEFIGFKYYWNNIRQPIYLYRDTKFDWESLNDEQEFRKIEQGLTKIINKYRKITGK